MNAPEPSVATCAARWLKTVCDRSLAAVLLVPAAPVIALTSLAVRLTSVGPAFYRQTRVGRAGRPFTLFKIRTMTVDSEKDGPRWSTPGDSRITPLGRLLRQTHLDELPQLWNVVKGDMSLVGPRPERPEFVPSLGLAIPRYHERLSVRPGVTGLAQVQLPADTDLDSVRRKLAYDLYYIEHGSLWLDFRLLLATGFKVLGMSRTGLVWLFRLPTGDAVKGLYGDIATPEPRLPPDSVVVPTAEPALPMLAAADPAR